MADPARQFGKGAGMAASDPATGHHGGAEEHQAAEPAPGDAAARRCAADAPLRGRASGQSRWRRMAAWRFRPDAAVSQGLRPVLQLTPALLLVVLCFLLPLGRAIWGSIDGAAFDFSRYGTILAEPLYRDVLLRSFEIALVVMLCCLMAGYPIAYLLTAIPRRRAALLVVFLLVPLFTAFLIRTYGWMSLLGRHGVLNTMLLALGVVDQPLRLLGTRLAVYIGMVHVLAPIAVFTLYASMARIDHALLRAARVLGAHPLQAFLRIYLPLSLPGIVAAGLLVFILAIGFFIAPVLLGSPADTMIAQLVVTQITSLSDLAFGYALAVLLLLVTVAALLIAGRLVPLEQIWAPQASSIGGRGRRRGRPGRLAGPVRWLGVQLERGLIAVLGRPAWLGGLLLRGYAVLFVAFMLAPLVVVYILSFSDSPFLVFPPPGFSWRWYEAFLTSPEWRAALWMSLRLAILVASLAVVIAAAAAFALVRGLLPGKRVVFFLIIAPLLVPVIIVALCLYVASADFGLLGSFPGLVIGHLLIAVPYAIVVLLGAVRGLDRTLEHAAATLGATAVLTLRRVVLPALLPGLASAWIMAFLHSFDELLVTLFLLGRQTETLPIRMWAEIRMQFDPVISAASGTIVGIVAGIVLLAQWRHLATASEPERRRR
ncbi:MAG TPA: ABC transporter permease subunit [Ferrovibrio sp.]|uniref:ABC transporter permease subunit n=1 Tax=Ferrovibrio sp. TaxID=1917215 RepID=UPI002ED010F7